MGLSLSTLVVTSYAYRMAVRNTICIGPGGTHARSDLTDENCVVVDSLRIRSLQQHTLSSYCPRGVHLPLSQAHAINIATPL